MRLSICAGVTQPLGRSTLDINRLRSRCPNSLPVLVLPRLVLLDGDLNGIAELAFRNLDGVVLAFFVDATSTCGRLVRILYQTFDASLPLHGYSRLFGDASTR
jgi:hypothetical protein